MRFLIATALACVCAAPALAQMRIDGWLANFAVSATSTTATVSSGALQINGVPYSRASCTVTITGGTPTGVAVAYVDENGTEMFVAPTGLTASTSGPCVYTTSASPAVPDGNAYAVATIVVTTGAFGAVTDRRTPVVVRNNQVGDGLQMDATKTTSSVDATVARRPGNNTWTGDNDFTAATKTAPHRTNSGAPAASCTVGATYFRTDATAGQNIYLCTATNTWTQVVPGSLANTMVQFLAQAPSSPFSATTTKNPLFTAGTLSYLPAGGCAVVAARMLNGSSGNIALSLEVGGSSVVMTAGTTATNLTLDYGVVCNRPGVQNAQTVTWSLNGVIGTATTAIDTSTSFTIGVSGQMVTGTSNITTYFAHGEAPQ